MVNERIQKLRDIMKEKNVDAYYIPTSDFHNSEYVSDYFKTRAYMSNFYGSAGFLLITQKEACLWTDARYFIIAANAIKDNEVKLMKMFEPNVPTLDEYIESHLDEIHTLGFDGRVVSANQMKHFKDRFDINFKCDEDLVDLFWTDRPELSKNKAFFMSEEYAGKSTNDKLKDIPRPSHADYVAHVKYHGFNDYRGGGHFSGRITAPIVAVGSIVLKALEKKNIYIGTHIKKCGNVVDQDFLEVEKEVKELSGKIIPVISNIEEDIQNEILKAKIEKDSIGGILQTAIIGLPVGLGQPWFSSVEGKIANAVFSIGGVKGIEFGSGFESARMTGSSWNDNMRIKDGKPSFETNHAGGILGGISNGNDIIFRIAIKPVPSIFKKQNTIDIFDNETEILIEGRHDICLCPRIIPVVEAMSAITLLDLFLQNKCSNFYKDKGISKL